MKSEFTFNFEKCVGCGSCAAACVLVNEPGVRPRSIVTLNKGISLPLPVMNLSIACNHCAEPACLKGCPAGAYHTDIETGAVIIDESKCLGCRYCQWNCPWDAPKYNEELRVIGKCNKCYTGLHEGLMPACSDACPTGALGFGDPKEENELPEWCPGNELKPSLSLSGERTVPLKVIPENIFHGNRSADRKILRTGDWSLMTFSFLAVITVSLFGSSLVNGEYPSPYLILPALACSLITSLFHLGKPFRAWRSVMNIRSSPLSREIALFLVFSVSSLFTFLIKSPSLALASVISGLLALLAIDSVYIYSERKGLILHSGQALLSGLLLISYLSGSKMPFLFISLLKLSIIIFTNGRNKPLQQLRFIRAAILVIIMSGTIIGFTGTDLLLTMLLISGEALDRFLFYADFRPENIHTLIDNYLKKKIQ
ncbi:MAG TPA: DmsC/YnfH family molybdoenzyme membrane anchor subunit [Bacteroidales bacterium]|nr:DmsC/YnfH family molybdoenzyme membrane anchor subunit [Bacteroidales bacterium]